MENCAFKKLENWSSKFDYVVDSHSGYVDTFENANEVIREFEISTTTTYASRFQTKDFGYILPYSCIQIPLFEGLTWFDVRITIVLRRRVTAGSDVFAGSTWFWRLLSSAHHFYMQQGHLGIYRGTIRIYWDTLGYIGTCWDI